MGMTRDELADRLEALDPLPSHYENASQHSWRRNRFHMRRRLAKNPDKFMKWGTVVATMLDGKNWHTLAEEQRLQDAQFELRDLCQPTGFGNDGHEYYNLVHQSHHLYEFMRHTGFNVADFTDVFEFGGGYGAMALIWYRMGFRGTYTIYDFPEMLLLQEYYLSNVGVPAQFTGEYEDRKYELAIATWSISEAPAAERSQYLDNADAHLLAYQPRWGGDDNIEFFDEYAEGRTDIEWFKVKTVMGPSTYLFGKKK